MDEQGFRLYLKQMGKKAHVVEGLVGQVRAFEAYLAGLGQASLEAAGERELYSYRGCTMTPAWTPRPSL